MQDQYQQQQPTPVLSAPQYDSEYSFAPIESESIYSNVYTEQVPQHQDTYSSHHQLHFDTQLQLALDDDNQADNQSMVSMGNNENIYQVHTPISPSTTPTLIPHEIVHQQVVVEAQNHYVVEEQNVGFSVLFFVKIFNFFAFSAASNRTRG